MSSIPSPSPALILIEDQLDAVAQKYRSLLILRGALLWVASAILSILLSCLIAPLFGPGYACRLLLLLLAGWFIFSFYHWILKPILFKPDPLLIARMIESQFPALHNGLTNSLLLSQASDIQSSPWLKEIFNEIWNSINASPIHSAIPFKSLRKFFILLGAVCLAALLLFSIPPMRHHLLWGFNQLRHPRIEAPKIGSVTILEVSPDTITLVAGQTLEIRVLAADPDHAMPPAILTFDPPDFQPVDLIPTSPDGQLHYAHHTPPIHHPLQFRVEIAGTQSPWHVVNVVPKIDLLNLTLNITPPAYTGQSARSLSLKPEQIAQTPISVLEGSSIDWLASVNPPASLAMLQLNEADPVEMKPWSKGERFDATFQVFKPLVAYMLLAENGQITGKLPEAGLRIACAADAPPRIEMKWPTMDLSVAPDAPLNISANLKDDIALTHCRILLSSKPDEPLAPVFTSDISGPSYALAQTLDIPANLRVHGKSIRLQIEATDNRNLPASNSAAPSLTPQISLSPVYQITFRDNKLIEKQREEELSKLRKILQDMLDQERSLHSQTVPRPANELIEKILSGQDDLRAKMSLVASTFAFSPDDKIIQKTLEVLALNTAAEAVEVSRAILRENVPAERNKLNDKLLSHQRRIMDVLETILGKLNSQSPTTQPGKPGGDLENPAEAFKNLDETLKKFMDEEKRILEANSSLVKKPVDDFDADDKKLLDELAAKQDKLDSLIKEAISDFSKLAEQDMANATLLKELMEVYSEVTMAKDALNQKAIDMSIPAEEMALELAKEISSNLEKWLMDTPDRLKWNQEDPLSKVDVPMAELPDELSDMIGELMEQQEDLFDDIEDTAANWADSLDKGAGWDAMDGPIANMTAKGVTGNVLPNNNEMNGRAGEGRTGKSSGEMVEDTATGKGGRDTPTRLDATPFQQGQINNQSTDPVGGATGGGKLSGQGGAGLEGPVPPKDLADKMQRLKGQQADLRNKLEKLELDKRSAPYDNFALMQAAANMRRVESDLDSNRYGNVLRRKDVVLDKMSESRALIEGEMHLKKDTSPQLSDKMEDDIHNAQDGALPPGWADALKEYYKRLSE